MIPSTSNFHQEYQKAVRRLRESGQPVAVQDLLENLGMLSDDQLENHGDILRRQRNTLLLTNFNEAVSKNLFQLLCVIARVNPVSRGHNTLESQILHSYLQSIDQKGNTNNDTILFEQLMMIKRLVNRSPYCLSTQQQRELQERYAQMFENRKEWLGGKLDYSDINAEHENFVDASEDNTHTKSLNLHSQSRFNPRTAN
jgi:hypothetical protein